MRNTGQQFWYHKEYAAFSFKFCARNDWRVFMEYHLSDLWQLDINGHEDIDFIDICVDRDTPLFIDPCRIEVCIHPIAVQCRELMDSYFDAFYEAYRTNDVFLQKRVLSHAREINCTRLGYGYPGKGNSQIGLREKFRELPSLIRRLKTMCKAQDLPIFLKDFAEDGMSDLLTNILHSVLNEYTLEQMARYNIEPNGEAGFYAWNESRHNWYYTVQPCYKVNGEPIMLVPKTFVRNKYLFGADQYFKRIILERIRSEGGGIDRRGKLIPKSVFYEHNVPHDVPNWRYETIADYTEKSPDLLWEYHRKLPEFYLDNGDGMSDEKLDDIVYGGSDRMVDL